ncbi:hypothetical protein [Rhizobium sp. Rhizsp82]|uniref:hypothetical protein n=1 Tax=Rhizobium sp. Rhizsp82 TaxID=3243057 RepID=UPI0039B3F502
MLHVLAFPFLLSAAAQAAIQAGVLTAERENGGLANEAGGYPTLPLKRLNGDILHFLSVLSRGGAVLLLVNKSSDCCCINQRSFVSLVAIILVFRSLDGWPLGANSNQLKCTEVPMEHLKPEQIGEDPLIRVWSLSDFCTRHRLDAKEQQRLMQLFGPFATANELHNARREPKFR